MVGMASRWFRGASGGSGIQARAGQGSSSHGGNNGGGEREGKKVVPRVSY